jgi:regulator of nonsense transcripts 1
MLNPQQKAAYIHSFRKLNCGICILPGGPGAGKTHFNLFTIAMAQSQQLPRPVMVRGRLERRSPKALFIIDMNSPVDDVANRMTAPYKELGQAEFVVSERVVDPTNKEDNKFQALSEESPTPRILFNG